MEAQGRFLSGREEILRVRTRDGLVTAVRIDDHDGTVQRAVSPGTGEQEAMLRPERLAPFATHLPLLQPNLDISAGVALNDDAYVDGAIGIVGGVGHIRPNRAQCRGAQDEPQCDPDEISHHIHLSLRRVVRRIRIVPRTIGVQNRVPRPGFTANLMLPGASGGSTTGSAYPADGAIGQSVR